MIRKESSACSFGKASGRSGIQEGKMRCPGVIRSKVKASARARDDPSRQSPMTAKAQGASARRPMNQRTRVTSMRRFLLFAQRPAGKQRTFTRSGGSALTVATACSDYLNERYRSYSTPSPKPAPEAGRLRDFAAHAGQRP